MEGERPKSFLWCCSQVDVLAKDCIAQLFVKGPVDSTLSHKLLCVFCCSKVEKDREQKCEGAAQLPKMKKSDGTNFKDMPNDCVVLFQFSVLFHKTAQCP